MQEYSSMTLEEWVATHASEEELRSIFLNMDRALKYIHEHGYCIEEFYPTEIQVLNNEDDYIQFKKLLKMPLDDALCKKIIQEDIFRSSLIQIGIYAKCLKYLKPNFLVENFDSFTQFIPNDDVPYYRGVIQRGASVYFCEYALEKRNRDLQDLEAQIGNGEGAKVLLKDNVDLTNNSINDLIYRQINGLKDKAFVHLLLIPTIVCGMLLIFGAILWVISTFS